MKDNEKLNEQKAMNTEAKIGRMDLNEEKLEQVTGGGWEDQFEQGYDELQHNLDVSTYLGEFYNRLANGKKEDAKKYYNSIKSKLNDRDKELFRETYRQATGESL